jgi:carboxyl-terminal processing protease
MRSPTPSTSFFKRYQPGIFILLFGLLQVLIVSIAFVCGFLYRDMPSSSVLSVFGKPKYPLFDEAMRLLRENALNPLPSNQKIEYGMIRGMLKAYDEPFTVFVEPPQHELQSNQLAGKFGGIGVRIDRDAESNVYLYPLPNSPAIKSGMQDGDRLLAIEALKITAEISNDEIQAAVRGPAGEIVKITVGRAPDYTPIELSIERAEVAIPSITWNLSPTQPSVGVVQIHVIAQTTPTEVTKAIEDLQTRGATRFILDVRNNGGGLVDAGVNTARLFLEQGVVIQQQYRGEDVKTYAVEKPGQFAAIPMVVLVNKGTASAAEIFTGAIQGQKRALVIGTDTYGKDTIQLVFSLSDGSSLHVTAARWWVPGLFDRIGGVGLKPDLAIDDKGDPNVALQAAIQAVLK